MQVNQEVPGFVIVSRKHSQKGCAGPLWQDLQNQMWWHWHRQTEHTVDRMRTVKLSAHASSSVKRKWWYHPGLLQKFSQVISGKHQAGRIPGNTPGIDQMVTPFPPSFPLHYIAGPNTSGSPSWSRESPVQSHPRGGREWQADESLALQNIRKGNLVLLPQTPWGPFGGGRTSIFTKVLTQPVSAFLRLLPTCLPTGAPQIWEAHSATCQAEQ